MEFAHLRAHSSFSLEDGILSPHDLAGLAKRDHMDAMAVTDEGKMFGSMQTYKYARKDGIKPIVGLEAWIENDITKDFTGSTEPTKLLLIAQNLTGYRNLMALDSRAYLENQVEGKALIKQSWLAERSEGVIALSGMADTGEIPQLAMKLAEMGNEESKNNKSDSKDGPKGVKSEGAEIEAADKAKAEAALKKTLAFYVNLFRDRYYLEIQRYDQDQEYEFGEAMVGLAGQYHIPLVATHPIQFAKREDFFTHEVRVAIAQKQLVEDINRTTKFTREQYFKSSQEMQELFADLPEALANAGEIAKRVNLEVPLETNSLPDFPMDKEGSGAGGSNPAESKTTGGTGEGQDHAKELEEYFVKETREGLEARLKVLYTDPAKREKARAFYTKRLDYELGCIIKMGFPGYFMIVADAIQWSKDHDIAIGPGRGSGASSLVAYSLKITDLDPLRFNLLFERFLNPDRVSMPDFDIDIDPNRREELFEHLRQKYGAEKVSQIAAMGTMAAKAAIKDVGRTLGYNYKLVDTISKMIPKKPDITLEKALEMEPKLKEKFSDKKIARLLNIALTLEGVPKTVSMHAGGLVIAPTKLTDFSPLYMDSDKKTVFTQYDKKDVELAGLVKFDFLALDTLTIIQAARKLIKQRTGQDLDINNIPLNDPAVFADLAKGDMLGIFQFEGDGMRAWAKRMHLDKFTDLIALNALYRPGPMDLIPNFVRRKNGEEPIEYPDPRVEKVLKETYGIMVYQEQVMQMVQLVGGYSLGEADLLRRAIGKKLPEEIAKHRDIFVNRAINNGVTKEKATEIYNHIEKFAGYGFNKSHAAAYSFVAYQTAYLKAHYPVEYYSALMNSAGQKNQERLDVLIKDAARHGVKVLPPDINHGQGDFAPAGEHEISYGLASLKGGSYSSINSIVEARTEAGEFASFMDFCRKVIRPGSKVNKTVMTALIRAGAFDQLESNRASLMASVEAGSEYAKAIQKQAAKAAVALIPDDELPALPAGKAKAGAKRKATKKAVKPKEIVEPALIEKEAWNSLEQLNEEFLAMGFYFSGHPYDGYREQLNGLKASTPLVDVNQIEVPEGQREARRLISGVVTSIRAITTSKGDPMAFVGLSDGSGRHEITLFSETWNDNRNWLKVGDFAAFEAMISQDPRKSTEEATVNRMTAAQCWDFTQLQSKLSEEIHVVVDKAKIDEFQQFLDANQSPEGAGLKVVLYHPDGEERLFRANKPLAVNLVNSPAVIRNLQNLVGKEGVYVGYKEKLDLQPNYAKRKYRR